MLLPLSPFFLAYLNKETAGTRKKKYCLPPPPPPPPPRNIPFREYFGGEGVGGVGVREAARHEVYEVEGGGGEKTGN